MLNGKQQLGGQSQEARVNEAELLLLAEPLSSVFINLPKELFVLGSHQHINQKSLISARSSAGSELPPSSGRAGVSLCA